MKSESIVLTKLEADDGMILTNGESFGRVAYLGAGDSPENWLEVPAEEAEAQMSQEGQPDD